MIMNKIIDVIRRSETIGICFHVNPVGDALGSSLALMQGLRQLNKKVYIMSIDKVPTNYKFLPYSNEVSGEQSIVKENTDCIIALDCGNSERLSANLQLGTKKYTLINIDHHLSNELYGNYNYVDTNASATGEIVYQIMQLMGLNIDKDIATCLYTSIITDTGAFKHSNTTSVTHTIAGDLINTGIDFSELHRIIFNNKKFERIKLYGKVIDNMQLIHNGRTCLMELTKEMLEDFNLEGSDTSDIISIGSDIDSAEVVILIKETDNGIKISLRSKNVVDVRKVAEEFGGGGHTRASGLSLPNNLEEARNIIIKAIEKELI